MNIIVCTSAEHVDRKTGQRTKCPLIIGRDGSVRRDHRKREPIPDGAPIFYVRAECVRIIGKDEITGEMTSVLRS